LKLVHFVKPVLNRAASPGNEPTSTSDKYGEGSVLFGVANQVRMQVNRRGRVEERQSTKVLAAGLDFRNLFWGRKAQFEAQSANTFQKTRASKSYAPRALAAALTGLFIGLRKVGW
jgi:hypothetical protein